jgi:hypothetical protein
MPDYIISLLYISKKITTFAIVLGNKKRAILMGKGINFNNIKQ